MTSALFSRIQLADLELANRIVVSPMCQYSADDGVASDWHLNHLGMLANSGAALLVIEATGVERRGRARDSPLPPLWNGQAWHPARPRRPQSLRTAAMGRGTATHTG